MKKIILCSLLVVLCISVYSQGTVIQSSPVASNPSAGNYNKQIYQWANAKFLLTLGIPNGNGFTNNNSTPVKGNIYFDNVSNRMGVWTGSKFDTLAFENQISPSLTFTSPLIKTGNNVTFGGDYTGSVTVGNFVSSTKGSLFLDGSTASLVKGHIPSGNYGEISVGTNGTYISRNIGGGSNQNAIIISGDLAPIPGKMTVQDVVLQRGLGDALDYSENKQPLDYPTVKMLRDSVQLLRSIIVASDTSVVHKNGTETINGLKTINNKLIVNTAPTNPADVVRLSDLDSKMKYGVSEIVMDGSETVFNIPHGLGSNPTSISITFEDASNLNLVQSVRTKDATNITLTCSSPPAIGTTNIYWQVFK